jgi:hypothetical protein
MEWLLVWEAYRRLHAYARKHREAVLPDQRSRMTATLPTKPYTAVYERACQRLAGYIDRLREPVHTIDLANLVLWSRWIAMSPGAVWRGPMDGWIGLVWRPITAFVPAEDRGGFTVFEKGWRAFQHRECQDRDLVKVRFPLEPDPRPSKSAGEVALQLAALRTLQTAHPRLSRADFLRFYRPDGEPLNSAFSRAEWLPIFYAATPECWDVDTTTRLPWLAQKVPDWPRFLEGLLTVAAERRALARMVYLLGAPMPQRVYARALDLLQTLITCAGRDHGIAEKVLLTADAHWQVLLYDSPYPPLSTSLTT